jgi:hypothetical protein
MPRRIAALTLSSLLLAACGGGDEGTPDSTGCFAATPITARAQVNWDRSPHAISPGTPPGCDPDFTVLGWLATDPTSPPLTSYQVMMTAVYSGVQQIYQGPILTSGPDPVGTGQLRVLAQGCTPAGLTEGMSLYVVFWLRNGAGAEVAIGAPPTPLTLSY